MTRSVRWRPRRRDSGAVAVEAALVTPMILLMVFGMVELGLATKDYLAISSAVRAGARVASAEPRVATFLDDTVSTVSRSSAGLSKDPSTVLYIFDHTAVKDPVNGCASRCVKYIWNPSATGPKQEMGWFELSGGSWSYALVNACPGDSGRDAVGVQIRTGHQFVTGFFSDLTLVDEAVMDFEPVPPLSVCR